MAECLSNLCVRLIPATVKDCALMIDFPHIHRKEAESMDVRELNRAECEASSLEGMCEWLEAN